MPGRICCRPDGRGVHIVWTGTVSVREIAALKQQIYAADNFTGLRYQLWDFSAAVKGSTSRLQPADMTSFAMLDRYPSARNPDMVVILVGDPSYFCGLEYLYQTYSKVWTSSWRCELFTTTASAEVWLATAMPRSE